MLNNPENFTDEKRWNKKPCIVELAKINQVKHMQQRCMELIESKSRPDFKQSYLTGVLDGLAVALHILDEEE